jgi:hypothetical protein
MQENTIAVNLFELIIIIVFAVAPAPSHQSPSSTHFFNLLETFFTLDLIIRHATERGHCGCWPFFTHVAGMEVKPCNGGTPLVSPETGVDYDCGSGLRRQDCPSGSYCHQTPNFAKCCRKGTSSNLNSLLLFSMCLCMCVSAVSSICDWIGNGNPVGNGEGKFSFRAPLLVLIGYRF